MGTISYRGRANIRTISSEELARAGFPGVPTLRWDRTNDYTLTDVPEALIALLTFVDPNFYSTDGRTIGEVVTPGDGGGGPSAPAPEITFARTSEYSAHQGSGAARTLFPEGASHGVFTPVSNTVDVELEIACYGGGVAHFIPFIIWSQTLQPPLQPEQPLYLGAPEGLGWMHLGVIRGQGTHQSTVRLTDLEPGVPCNFEVFGGVVGYSHSTYFEEIGWVSGLVSSPIRREVYNSDIIHNKVTRWGLPHTIDDVFRRGNGAVDEPLVTVTTAAGPIHLAIVQDSDVTTKLAVVCANDDVVEIRSGRSLDLIDTVPSSALQDGTIISSQWSPDGRYLYTSTNSGTIRKLDGQNDWSTVWDYHGEAAFSGMSVNDIRISPDGTKIAFMIHTRYVYVISTENGEYVGYRDFGNSGTAPVTNTVAWEPNSRYLWAPGRSYIVHRLDTNTPSPTAIVNSSLSVEGRVRDLAVDGHNGSVGVLMYGGTNRLAFLVAGSGPEHRIGKIWEKAPRTPAEEPGRLVMTPDSADFIIQTNTRLLTLDGSHITIRPEDMFWGERARLRIKGATA